MGQNKDYNQEVYRRLELVQKQFKTHSAEEKREQSRARRQAFWEHIRQNKTQIGRITLYVILGLLLTAVIIVVILDRI